ncbi:hypothetical protein OA84_06200 [Kaistella solincola]|uniref:Uncharacterized protein n=1 Tax=Kaistella solincola TaxID=510955 RepID=A0ABR4ZQ16_9FLAO|nr:hypothetical protein [Kaistella solincola]KIA83137.1 hypothetical protein OA84_06200 [Kaistella solincola]
MKIEQTVIDQIRSRPRFKIFTDISREQYTVYLKNFLNENADRFEGNVNNESVIITVKSANNHYWKPCLALRTEIDPEENKTLVRGIFGPTSAVWTFFMFLNFIFGILWMIAITLWYVEKQIKSSDFTWALPVSFVMLACLGLTFLAARIGKFQAKNEMEELRNFAEESIRKFEDYEIPDEEVS